MQLPPLALAHSIYQSDCTTTFRAVLYSGGYVLKLENEVRRMDALSIHLAGFFPPSFLIGQRQTEVAESWLQPFDTRL